MYDNAVRAEKNLMSESSLLARVNGNNSRVECDPLPFSGILAHYVTAQVGAISPLVQQFTSRNSSSNQNRIFVCIVSVLTK